MCCCVALWLVHVVEVVVTCLWFCVDGVVFALCMCCLFVCAYLMACAFVVAIVGIVVVVDVIVVLVVTIVL